MSESPDQSNVIALEVKSSNAKLNAAFAKAQGAFVQPEMNRTAEVKKEGRLLYTTHYADLHAIVESIRKALSENELSFTQAIAQRGNGWVLVLTLRHSSGEETESVMPLTFGSLTAQQIGSQLTYLKRYQVSAFFGIAADADDDGNGAVGNEATFGEGKKTQPRGGNQQQRQSPPPQQKPPAAPPKQHEAPKDQPQKTPGRNEAPASGELLNDLAGLQQARGVSDSDLTNLLKVGFGWNGSQIPTFFVEQVIEHLKNPSSGPESLQSLSVQMEIARTQASKKSSPPPAKDDDPANFIMPVGSKDVKGKRLAELGEATLKTIRETAGKELQKPPGKTNVAQWFEIQTKVKAFLKSVGVE